MEKQCHRCFIFLPIDAFNTGRNECKPCRAELQRNRRILMRGGVPLVPSHLIPSINYLKALFRTYNGTTTLEIPVKAFNHVVPAARACLVKRIGAQDWICIASQRGTKQLTYNTTGPDALISTLRAMGLEVLLPNDKDVKRG